MDYINILKKPLEYNRNLDKYRFVDSLIMSGISFGIAIITVLFSIKLIISSMLNNMLGASLFSFGNQSIPFKIYLEIFFGALIGFILAMALITTILFLIRKISMKESTFEQAFSIISTALVVPSVILPIIIIGVLLEGEITIHLMQIVLLVFIAVFMINIFETCKEVGGFGNGKSIYVVPVSIVSFIYLLIYVTFKILVSFISIL